MMLPESFEILALRLPFAPARWQGQFPLFPPRHASCLPYGVASRRNFCLTIAPTRFATPHSYALAPRDYTVNNHYTEGVSLIRGAERSMQLEGRVPVMSPGGWWGLLTLVQRCQIFRSVSCCNRELKDPEPVGRAPWHLSPCCFFAPAAYVFGLRLQVGGSPAPLFTSGSACSKHRGTSVFVGLTVATVAETCFAAQWAIILAECGSDTTVNIAW